MDWKLSTCKTKQWIYACLLLRIVRPAGRVQLGRGSFFTMDAKNYSECQRTESDERCADQHPLIPKKKQKKKRI